jgi:hypothetical protein
MFTLDNRIKRLNVKPSDVITLISSINSPYVAVGGPAREAEVHVVSIKEKNNSEVYICFHMVADRERLFYSSEKSPVPESKRVDLEEEAVRFVEDMGFIMVNRNISECSKDERIEIISKAPPFVGDLGILYEEKKKEAEQEQVTEEEIEDEEYEEVVEEVYEEVEVDEEDDEDEEDEEDESEDEGGDEEYETLDDIVKQVDEEKVVTTGDTKGTYDLRAEISDVVKSAEPPPQGEIKQKEHVSADTGDAIKAPPPTAPRQTEYFVKDELRYLVRLLISL